MKRYKLKINSKNKTFVVRGIPVRTPVTINKLTKKELDFYLSKIRFEGILEKDYEIEEDFLNQKTKINTKNVNQEPDELNNIEEEDNYEMLSTLEKIVEDSKKE